MLDKKTYKITKFSFTMNTYLGCIVYGKKGTGLSPL